MATKENMTKVGNLLANLLKKGDDWAKLTINGLTVQKLPARLDKNGNITKPSTLALIFNPIINGLQARKGKYFYKKSGFKGYLGAIEDKAELSLTLLDIIERVNPNVAVSKPSDYTFDL